jgi:hypothetical protein
MSRSPPPAVPAEPCCCAPPAEPCSPAGDELPDSPALPDGGLPDEALLGLLLEELLLGELLLLEELLLEELLDDEELELGVDGGVGVCGVVGLLALGQPLSNTQALAMAASFARLFCCALFNAISPDHFFGIHRFAVLETGTEFRLAQFAHQAVGLSGVDLVFINPLQVYHTTFFCHPEF